MSPRELCSFKEIFAVAVPAIFLNAAPTATTTVQTALLGKFGGAKMLAAFAAVSITANASSSIFNFLVDGVSAKVGKCVAERNWGRFFSSVRLSFLCSVVCGIISACVLAALKHPLQDLLKLQGEVIQVASPYWWTRVMLLPVALMNMGVSGVLQGYKRVHLTAALIVSQAVLEIVLSSVVLVRGLGPLRGLAGMGVVQLGAAGGALAVGVVCVVLLPPPEAPQTFGVMSILRGTSYTDITASEPLVQNQGGTGVTVHADAGPLGGPPHDDTGALMEGLGEDDDSHLWDFLRDGSDMLVRSICLQATFFIGMVVAGRLGTTQMPSRYVLAGHQIVNQLWLITVYVVDGFAASAIVLGSRLMGIMAAVNEKTEVRSCLRSLTTRTLLLGLACGVGTGAYFWFGRQQVIGFFTSEEEVKAVLDAPLWLLLCIMQPINAVVFVYDGLMYAAQAFRFVRNAMLSGTVLLFAPAITGMYFSLHSLMAVWGAKAILNFWRWVTAAWLVHVQLPKTETEQQHASHGNPLQNAEEL